MKLRRHDRSLYGAVCFCKKEDNVCRFPTIGDNVVPHHSYCSVYKAVRRCWYQKQFWLKVANYISAKKCRSCCKYCVCIASLSRHCMHCSLNDRFLAAQMEALMWENIIHNIIQRDTEISWD